MNVFEAISTRYSHKGSFLPDPVPLKDLECIARAGFDAPSGANRQSVKLVILPDRAALDPVAEVVSTEGLRTAPAAIALLTDKTVTPEGAVNFEKEDYSAAMQNILLAATALGYSSLWLDHPYWGDENEKNARVALNASDDYKLWAVIPIGKPDGEGSRREKQPFENRVFYTKFGQGKP